MFDKEATQIDGVALIKLGIGLAAGTCGLSSG